MFLRIGLFALIAALFVVGTVADLLDSAALLPACGLKCTVSVVSTSSCGLTNQTCICTTPEIAANVTACLTASCSIRDALTTAKVSGATCGRPVRDRTADVIWLPLALAIIAGTAVCLRVWARMKIGIENVGIDDYVIIVAGLAMIPFTGLGMLLGFKGLGKDMWEVPFDNITYIFEIYFIDESIFFLILALTKTAIILFYLRIFPDRGFRKIAYGMLAINVIWGFVVILITIFQCAPVHYFWERWDKTTNGKCNNSHAQAWASAIVNIVLDLAILILPLPQLLKVALKPKKKFHVCMMFSVGIFVTITSILRLRTLIQFANSHNPLWDYVPATYWSAIEADVGIICACMPAIRSLLGSYFPALFDTSISSSGGVNSTPYMPPPPQILSQTHRSRAGLKPGDENHFVQLDEIHMDEYTLGGGGGGGGGGGERKTEREKMRERREKEMAGDLEDDDDHDHAYPGGATADFHSEHGSERGIIQKRSESQMEQRRSLEKGRRGTMGLAV